MLYWLINKFNLFRIAYILAAVFLLGHIISRGIMLYTNPAITADSKAELENVILFRNAWFMGFPFFMAGNFIRRYQTRIVKKCSNKVLLIIIPVGLLISCGERLLVPLEIFFGTLIATFAMFIYAVKNPEKKVIPTIATIGGTCATAVYIAHPIVNTIFREIITKIGLEDN